MSIGTALVHLPWKQVIAMLPSIVHTARELMMASRKQPAIPVALAETTEGLALRVDRLEENEHLQAELVKKIVDQQQGLAEGLQFMAARITALIWLAAIALILALASLVIVLLK